MAKLTVIRPIDQTGSSTSLSRNRLRMIVQILHGSTNRNQRDHTPSHLIPQLRIIDRVSDTPLGTSDEYAIQYTSPHDLQSPVAK